MSDAAITLRDVTVAYGQQPALRHIAGRFPRGSLTAICGPNGAGKSTLLKAIAGRIPQASGAIDRGGLSPRQLGFLPQDIEIDRSFPLSVADLVLLGAWQRIGAFRRADRAIADQARSALEAVGLTGLERRSLDTLSAGQMRRALFARLLLQDAPILLLDEPFTAIDARTIDDLLRLIHRLHRSGRTILVVLHDLELVRAQFPTTLLLAREAVGWGPTAQVLTPQRLAQAKLLGAAWDDTLTRDAA